MNWRALFENPRGHVYQWRWSGAVDRCSVEGVTEGTLAEAIEAAQDVAPSLSLPGPSSQVVITLLDAAGWTRGWVKGDGNYTLK